MADLDQLKLRRATVNDAILFYALRMDRETQRFLPDFLGQFTFQIHLEWFISRVDRAQWYVAEVESVTLDDATAQQVGILRSDGHPPDMPWISIIVAPAFRGAGIGTAMLIAYQGLMTKVQILNAKIHTLNRPSVLAFGRAGFTLVASSADSVWQTYRWTRKKP